MGSASGSLTEELITNGVSIDVGRTLHGALGGAECLVCPACQATQPMGDTWAEATSAYVDRGELFVLSCESCGIARPLIDWHYDSEMALGTLGITFRNWPPLKRSFVEELEGLIEVPLVVVRGTF